MFQTTNQKMTILNVTSYMFKLHQSASKCGIPKKIALNWWNVVGTGQPV